jgi:hypothetical protein
MPWPRRSRRPAPRAPRVLRPRRCRRPGPPACLLPSLGSGRGCPGARWGTGTLIGVLKATVRDPAVGPRRQTESRPPTTKDTPASAGNPAHFHTCAASRRDTSTETKITRVATGSAAPRRAELGRADPILIPRGGPRPWGSYQQNAGNRCANGRIRRSRSTIVAEVMCSHRVQLYMCSRPSPRSRAPRSTSSLL